MDQNNSLDGNINRHENHPKQGSEARAEEELKNLEVIHESWNEHEVNIIVSYLQAQDIPAFIRREVAYNVIPVGLGEIGKFQIIVPHQFANEARKLLTPEIENEDNFC